MSVYEDKMISLPSGENAILQTGKPICSRRISVNFWIFSVVIIGSGVGVGEGVKVLVGGGVKVDVGVYVLVGVADGGRVTFGLAGMAVMIGEGMGVGDREVSWVQAARNRVSKANNGLQLWIRRFISS